MRIYLTGSTGSLGTGVLRYFKNNEIVQSSINILNKKELEKSVVKSKCDAIMHTAAIVGSGSCDAFGNELTTMVNVGGTQNIIDIAKKHSLKLIHFSSTAIYGRNDATVITEKTGVKPNTLYAITKWLSEMSVLDEIEPENRMLIRPVMVYHSNDAFTNQKSINYAVQSILKREPQIVLNLDPETFKCYTHIEDFCRTLEGLIDRKQWKKEFNISCGENKKERVDKIFRYISEVLENESTGIVFRAERDTLGNHVISNRNAEKCSKVKPKYSVYKGINEIIKNHEAKTDEICECVE